MQVLYLLHLYSSFFYIFLVGNETTLIDTQDILLSLCSGLGKPYASLLNPSGDDHVQQRLTSYFLSFRLILVLVYILS